MTRPTTSGRPPASSPEGSSPGGVGPDSSRPRTIFLGSGAFGVETLQRLVRTPEADAVAVVTAPPRPAGRGKRLLASPIDLAARELGIETILTPTRLRAQDSLAAILALDPALLVLADYGQLVPQALLGVRFGALNLHPSLLPRHRGASPIPATILAGDTRTGVTLMRMDAGLDTGPIVATAQVGLSGREAAPELERVLAIVAAELLERSIGPWLRGEIRAQPQRADGATITRQLRREDGRLDPALPATILERQVRAYQPWPGSWLDTADGRLIVWRASAAPAPGGASPGQIVRLAAELGLVTADGVLVIHEAQPAGGRRMSASDLLRGRPSLATAP